MDALAGIYDPGAEHGDVERTLARMKRVFDLPFMQSRAWRASAPGVGCLVLDHQDERMPPCLAREESLGLWLMFTGELYARDELRARLAGSADPADSDAQLCLRLYLREGADFVQLLNGHFNVVIYRAAERHLSIATDPFGYRPLFLAAGARRLLFASEMKAILAALDSTPAVDGIGLLQLLRHGWPLGERTWLEPIQLAAAGTWYEIAPSGVRQRRYFRCSFRRGHASSSLAAYVEGFADKLHRAMQRATAVPGRVGIALSGGLDSRALLLAAEHCDRLLLAYTFGRASSGDVRFAADLARIAAVPHLHLTYGAGYLGRCLSPIVWRTEGLLPFSEATYTSMGFHHTLAQRVDIVLYGHAGDALTGAHLPYSALLWRSKDRLVERVFRQYGRVPDLMLQRVFRASFYRRFAPDLFASWRETFASVDQDDLADVLNVWDMEQRQRRGTFASTAIERYRFGVRAPFLDRELVEHLRQAPPIWRLQQQAYKQMIVTGFPRAAAVPWAHTGAPLQTQRLADFAVLARRYAHRRLRRALSPCAAPATDPQAFRDLRADTRGDQRLAHSIRDFAASSSFPAEVFDRQGIEEVVRRHWEGAEDLTHLVSMLATVATAYRLLLWQRPSAIPAEATPVA